MRQSARREPTTAVRRAPVRAPLAQPIASRYPDCAPPPARTRPKQQRLHRSPPTHAADTAASPAVPSWLQLPFDLFQRLVVRIELAHLAQHFARAVVLSELPKHLSQMHADVRILLLAPRTLQVRLGLAEIAEAVLQPAPRIQDFRRTGFGRERL